jgi:hypothetical protein
LPWLARHAWLQVNKPLSPCFSGAGAARVATLADRASFSSDSLLFISSWTGLLGRLPGVAGSNFVLCWQQPARTDIRANRIAIGLFVISPSLISGVTRYRGTNFTDFGGAAVAVPKMPCGEYRFTCVFNLYRTVSASQSILFAL